jgi:hypothetical protein
MYYIRPNNVATKFWIVALNLPTATFGKIEFNTGKLTGLASAAPGFI